MLGPAIGMYFVHQHRYSLGRRETRDSVAKIKDMAALVDGPEVINDASRLSADCYVATQQSHGIKVALQRNRIAGSLAYLGEVGGPVQADSGTPTRGDLLYPLGTAFGEYNGRHNAAFMLAYESLHDLARIVQ